jgi:uncharacterized protein
MAISMYSASVPLFRQLLDSLSAVLDKGEAFAAAKKIDETVLTGWRLAADMLPMRRQVQIASDTAKGAAARLAGVEIPSFADDETNFAELKARVARTIDFLGTIRPEQIDGSEEREIVLKMRTRELTFTGQRYLLHWAIPNFTFHCTTAYDILRLNGVEIGKAGFIGQF